MVAPFPPAQQPAAAGLSADSAADEASATVAAGGSSATVASSCRCWLCKLSDVLEAVLRAAVFVSERRNKPIAWALRHCRLVVHLLLVLHCLACAFAPRWLAWLVGFAGGYLLLEVYVASRSGYAAAGRRAHALSISAREPEAPQAHGTAAELAELSLAASDSNHAEVAPDSQVDLLDGTATVSEEAASSDNDAELDDAVASSPLAADADAASSPTSDAAAAVTAGDAPPTDVTTDSSDSSVSDAVNTAAAISGSLTSEVTSSNSAGSYNKVNCSPAKIAASTTESAGVSANVAASGGAPSAAALLVVGGPPIESQQSSTAARAPTASCDTDVEPTLSCKSNPAAAAEAALVEIVQQTTSGSSVLARAEAALLLWSTRHLHLFAALQFTAWLLACSLMDRSAYHAAVAKGELAGFCRAFVYITTIVSPRLQRSAEQPFTDLFCQMACVELMRLVFVLRDVRLAWQLWLARQQRRMLARRCAAAAAALQAD